MQPGAQPVHTREPRPGRDVAAVFVDVPIAAAGLEDGAAEFLLKGDVVTVFDGLAHCDGRGAVVEDWGEEDPGEVGDADFAGEESGVVGGEGVGAEEL